MIEVRDATPSDAEAICELLRRSQIVELCGADHHDDPAILARWLSNKTPKNVLTWIERQDSSMLVAVENGSLLAAGSVTDSGEITLNYVSPDARFRGASRALLRALVRRAADRGNDRCRLVSTATAGRFYRTGGYVEDGVPIDKFGTRGCYSDVEASPFGR